MTDRLADETALVTGASSGIGRAIAMRFAREGADVVVADVREEPREGGKLTHERVEAETDQRATFVETDVSVVDDIAEAVATATETFGGLDVMVNNAGVFRANQPIESVEPEDYDWLMDINLRGVYFGSKLAAEAMRGNGGSVVNLSSIAGLVGYPGASAYCASKGGITNLTRALALELGPEGVRVNAINPGVIETAMTTEDTHVAGEMDEQIPLRRDGQPEDVADAALFLASDESAYVTGHNLVVDGGYTAQ
ncbi:SDR family oxidoreductase [Haloarcula onubensis]|uniref:SDR family oxidoreductase n=1 Tax=Haloarcula onubensis TaxID=2950539 RepID=A0ABU2FV10_9EURY|nr:SDR family oxidoreductase [Halomicroarcula sp. S3CR25-11]MDS0284583.1 SDR family oxidoreductase [Halomicroarcula sp. S3CR25-11]